MAMVNVPMRGTPGATYQPVDPNAPQASGPLPMPADGTVTGGGSAVGNYLHGVVNSIPGPAATDNSSLGQAQSSALASQAQFDAARRKLAMNPAAAPTAAGAPQLVSNSLDPNRAQQQTSVNMLQQAAQGNVPSAAMLQQQQAGDRAASQQFGMAAALQGGMSPGNALRQASEGASQLQATTANNNAVLRAQEMATARQGFNSAAQGQRGQEQDLAGQNAGLIQQGNLANLNSQLTTTGQNQAMQQSLLGAQTQALGYQTQGAGSLADANAKTAAATNAYNSSYVGAGGNVLKKLLPF